MAADEAKTTTGNRWARNAASYHEPLRSAAHHPASWLFVAICLLALGYLILAGYATALPIVAGTLVGTALFLLITLPLTTPVAAPPWAVPTPDRDKPRLWAQVGVLAVFALLLYQWTLNGNIPLPAGLSTIPLWTPFLEWAYHATYALIGSHVPATYALNNLAPIIMLIVPGAVLLLLGARPVELGFARGYRSWRVAAVWSAVPALIVAINLVSAAFAPAALANLGWRTLQTTFNSGPFEEFFFRGALFTRLARLQGDGWAIVLSGLAFGLLHVGAEAASDARGNLLAGAALAILLQGVGGVGFAVVFRRTRNLLASSIIHVISNVGFG